MNEFIGFNFLPQSMHPAPEVRRGYVASPAAVPGVSTTDMAYVVGTAIAVGAAVHHTLAADHLFPLAVGQA